MLGLSQGSVSELLSKPKPWHMLSIKGREPFIRMQLWLNDPQNVDKLQVLKTERREGVKRKRIGGGIGTPGSGFDSSSDRSSPADPNDIYSSSADSPGSAKKQRILFSDDQKEALKIAFALDPYPSTSVMDFLSQDLGLESRSISNWFHNHRMRLKQHGGQEALPFPGSREGQTFDPVKYKLLCHQRMLESQSEDSRDAISSGMTSFLRQFGLPISGDVSRGPPEGLDLSFKNRGDDEKDSIAASSDNDDEEDNNAVTTAAVAAAAAAAAAAVSSSSGRSSRRKPAAPQWVRPEWAKQEEKVGEGGLTINGVCVMNSYAFDAKKSKKEESGEEHEEEDGQRGSVSPVAQAE